jgi:tetratricopeptide (TPR) repeat protein
LERAIELEPNVGLAHKLLGEIAYGAERFEDAVQHYGVAMRQDPNDGAVQDGFFAARQALHAQWASDRLFSPHFMVQYPGAAHRPAAQAVTEALENVYREVGEKLSVYPPEPVMVILYQRGQFQEAAGAPQWADGLFDGKIHVALDGARRGAPALQATLAHEYTHALVHRLSGGNAPTWLNEGLALVVESDIRGSIADDLARYARDLMPLSSLHGAFVDLSPAAARIAYAESRAATRALIQRFGLRRVRQLLETLATEPDFDRTFAAALATSYREFDRTWLAAETGVKR